jgi:2-polyprenyl-3-methyl-5-hydroxy-6-metoxy-1,4-benzoquinol methylase
MSLRTDYDVWHERIFSADPEHEDASSPWYRLVREQLGSVSGLRVLEVACGRGGFVRELCRAGAQVTGCDFSLAALHVAGEKLRALGNGGSWVLVQGDAQGMPFADESFDIVISCETIEHVPDVKSALREMWRVAGPGAKFFLTTPNYANLMGLYDLYARVRHPGRKDDQPFDRRQWFSQIWTWVKEAGWTIVRTDGTVHQIPILPGHNPVAFPALESSRWIRKALSPFALHCFVFAEKRGPRK